MVLTCSACVQQLSSIARLQQTMAHHAALQDARPPSTRSSSKASLEAAPRSLPPSPSPPQEEAKSTRREAHGDSNGTNVATTTPSSVAALAEQLQSLWRPKHAQESTRKSQLRRNVHADEMEGDDEDNGEGVGRQRTASSLSSSTARVRSAFVKIGSNEKDELLLHLLQQVDVYRTRLDEVATLGETIATQLVHQQHELRLKHREQVASLEKQVHDAVYFHPRIATLEAQVEVLEDSNHDKDKKLHFAVQKLQRSRKREKELQSMQDPLWDI